MVTLNKAFIIGRVTRDPDMRYTQGGTAVVNFGVALNRVYTVNDEKKEEVTYVDVCAWGKTAEFVKKYFEKGKNIFVEGRLNMREWEDKNNGTKRTKLEIVADNIQFVGDKQSQGGNGATTNP
jgi:single-strand DNA-binding protein